MDGLGSRFAMHELGISSKKPFKKCARVVGEVGEPKTTYHWHLDIFISLCIVEY